MHTVTFTVDGYIGDTNLQGKVFSGVTSYNIDINNQLLTMNFGGSPPVFVDISSAATITTTVSGGYVTAVTIAD